MGCFVELGMYIRTIDKLLSASDAYLGAIHLSYGLLCCGHIGRPRSDETGNGSVDMYGVISYYRRL